MIFCVNTQNTEYQNANLWIGKSQNSYYPTFPVLLMSSHYQYSKDRPPITRPTSAPIPITTQTLRSWPKPSTKTNINTNTNTPTKPIPALSPSCLSDGQPGTPSCSRRTPSTTSTTPQLCGGWRQPGFETGVRNKTYLSEHSYNILIFTHRIMNLVRNHGPYLPITTMDETSAIGNMDLLLSCAKRNL